MPEIQNWEVDEAAVMELLRSDPVGNFLRGIAQQGVEYARSIAPRWSGGYIDSLDVVPNRVEAGELVAGFGSSSYTWHWVEFGSANNAPHRPLSNAAQAVCDRVEFRQ